MNLSFRIKLVVSISILIIVLLASGSFIFLKDKEKTLSTDIFNDVVTFAQFSSPKLIQAYDSYLEQDGFIYFKSVISPLMDANNEVQEWRLVNFDGEVLYNSVDEVDAQYSGPKRILGDASMIAQVQAFYPSVFNVNGQTAFVKLSTSGELIFVDANENKLDNFDATTRIFYLVQPVDGKKAVIYYLNYDQLDSDLAAMRLRILLLASLGVILAVLLAMLLAGKFARSISKLTIGAEEIAKGNFGYQVDVKTGDELEILASAFNQMAIDLEKSTQAIIYKEKVAHEIQMAATIQQSILPKSIPKLAGLDISAGVLPAEEIGGDLYDFVPVDEDNMMMYLGDVTGHGIPSGIVVSIANALFYSLAYLKDMIDVLARVNTIVKMKTTQTMFLTLCLLNWNTKEQQLSYVSAGHEQLIHYSAKDGAIKVLAAGGIALGMVDEIKSKLQEVNVEMEKGDVVVVYSDGIPEAWRSESENYGMERLKSIIGQVSNLETALAVQTAIWADVKQFTAGYKQMDDMTILVLKKI